MCGIVGIFNYRNSNTIITEILESLKKLKNRGRDSYGILFSNTNNKVLVKDYSVIDTKKIEELYISNSFFNIVLGHSRYATSYQNKDDKVNLEDTHPIKGNHALGEFYLIHNGNINFSSSYKEKYIGLNDTKIMVKIIENMEGNDWFSIIEQVITSIPGVYNILISINNKLYAFKDRYNNRPLCIGKNRRGFCLASESIALDNYNYLREIEGGEIIELSNGGIESNRVMENVYKMCLFEYIYFLNPKSRMGEHDIYSMRYSMGYKLGETEEKNIYLENSLDLENSVVIGSPDTGIPSGIGFAEALGIRYQQFLEKNKNKGRSFIMSNDQQRKEECMKKFLINPDFSIENKIVYFVDDSIVRGNTTRRTVNLLKQYKPKEIHIRISSPKIIDICNFGIDIPTKDELVMAQMSVEKYVKSVEINSLRFLELDEIVTIVGNNLGVSKESLCVGCFSGNYERELLDW